MTLFKNFITLWTYLYTAEVFPLDISIQFFQRIFQFTNLIKKKLIIKKTTRFFIAHFVVFISKLRILSYVICL